MNLTDFDLERLNEDLLRQRRGGPRTILPQRPGMGPPLPWASRPMGGPAGMGPMGGPMMDQGAGPMGPPQNGAMAGDPSAMGPATMPGMGPGPFPPAGARGFDLNDFDPEHDPMRWIGQPWDSSRYPRG